MAYKCICGKDVLCCIFIISLAMYSRCIPFNYWKSHTVFANKDVEIAKRRQNAIEP